jgi:hypothetical protein
MSRCPSQTGLPVGVPVCISHTGAARSHRDRAANSDEAIRLRELCTGKLHVTGTATAESQVVCIRVDRSTLIVAPAGSGGRCAFSLCFKFNVTVRPGRGFHLGFTSQ